jgi:hypothetical protein
MTRSAEGEGAARCCPWHFDLTLRAARPIKPGGKVPLPAGACAL